LTSQKESIMKVSVIIPTYNAHVYIKQLIDTLFKQTLEFADILIIDSSSQDGTAELIKVAGVNVITIPTSEFDHGGTRSMGIKNTVGDIVIFLTQDALPVDHTSIKQLIKVFDDPKIGAAYGRQIPYPNETPFGAHLRLFNYQMHGYERIYADKHIHGIKTAFLSDSFAAYRREALEKIGLFENSLICSEDLYAGAKILKEGYSLAYVAEAMVYHSHGYSVKDEFKRYFDIGVFHSQEKWLISVFGTPESDGVKYVISELKHLVNHKYFFLIPLSIVRNIAKYCGYTLGKLHTKLPEKLNKALSMNSNWWNKSL